MPIVTQRFVDNAWRRNCDFITLDLEDSVPRHLKAHARSLVKDAIPNVAKGGADVSVRINHDTALADLNGAVWPGLLKIRYPKAESAEEIRAIDDVITRLERERGIRPGTIEIGTGIETAAGVAHAYEIASASPRIKEFGGGNGYDMSCNLGMEMFVGFDQFIYTKGEVELTARTLNMAPVRTVPFVINRTGNVKDGDRALREAVGALKCGFRGSGGGLNPAVVESHNKGYTPSEDDRADARWVLEQFRKLDGTHESWLEIDGRVIDRYEAALARETLAWAAQCAARDEEKAAAVARAKSILAATTKIESAPPTGDSKKSK